MTPATPAPGGVLSRCLALSTSPARDVLVFPFSRRLAASVPHPDFHFSGAACLRTASSILVLALAMAIIDPLAAQELLFSDDFNSTQIDPNRWKVSLPFSNAPASTVQESAGSVELFRRGILDATIANLPAEIDLEGRFRFTGESDTLSIVFRSDQTVTNQAERRGVQAALQQGTGRVYLIPEPFATVPISGTYLLGKDTNVTFRVTDNGETVRLYLQDFFTPVLSATITNRRSNRLSIYNFNGTTSRTRLDQFSAYSLQTSVFIDDTLLRTGLVRQSTTARIKLQSPFTNSTIFYSLDGSNPSFTSIEYRGSFALSNSATVRAIAYTPDFLRSSECSPVEFQYLPVVRLTNQTAGGGIINFDPPGPYLSNQVVTMTAVPAQGWQFLRWEGPAPGTSISNRVTLTNHLAVRAVFATTPIITTIGSGQVQTFPIAPPFEYGSTVRLMAVPGTGNYFFRWANAVTGAVSPTTLFVTNATPTVSALFSDLGSNQSSLTLLVDGSGTASVSPVANVLTNGQSTALTALPDFGHVFLGWTGSITGLSNPTTLQMNGSAVVTAHFAPGVRFLPAGSILHSNGFSLSMEGVPGFAFRLQQSSNLEQWTQVELLTNQTGHFDYLHRGATNNQTLFYRVVGN